MRRRRLTSQQESEVVELYVSSTPLAEIKTAYNLSSESSIYRLLRRRGIKPRRFNPMPEDQVSRALNVTVDSTDNVVGVQRIEQKGRYRFAVEFRVKTVVSADSMEAAIAQTKGYHGFEEVLAIRKVGE